MKAWQRGIALDQLQRVAALFRDHDDGLILGAFAGVNESRAAEWIDHGKLVMPTPGSALVCRALSVPMRVKDFRGVPVVTLPRGAVLVERVGYNDDGADVVAAIESFADRGLLVAAWLFQEHAGDRAIAERMGWQQLAVKIRASSELIGLWGDPRLAAAPLDCAETLGVVRLDVPVFDVRPLLSALGRLPQFAQHYSSYNIGGSWTALALRGFGDPTMIEKPAEMSRKWKAEHPALLDAPCVDTCLRAQLPEIEPILAALPAPKERVRFMGLGPGGRLSRHADITDHDAGASEGRLMRLHVPLSTNDDVSFSSWHLDGTREAEHMAAGETWFLDTRKPHEASNAGTTDRVHLVVDCWATADLLALLPCH